MNTICGAFAVLFGASGEGGLRSPQKNENPSAVCGLPHHGTFHNGVLGGPNPMLRHRMCTTGNPPIQPPQSELPPWPLPQHISSSSRDTDTAQLFT